jgi:hypothetical protein
MTEPERVLDAIAAREDPDDHQGPNGNSNNDFIAADTGLDRETVDRIVKMLWRTNQIEGVLLPIAGVQISDGVYLDGIRRVLSGRPRLWGADGYYRPTV